MPPRLQVVNVVCNFADDVIRRRLALPVGVAVPVTKP